MSFRNFIYGMMWCDSCASKFWPCNLYNIRISPAHLAHLEQSIHAFSTSFKTSRRQTFNTFTYTKRCLRLPQISSLCCIVHINVLLQSPQAPLPLFNIRASFLMAFLNVRDYHSLFPRVGNIGYKSLTCDININRSCDTITRPSLILLHPFLSKSRT